MRILMLGNSFTFFNDLPEMLRKGLRAEVVAHTRGGARLAEHRNPDTDMGARTQKALTEETWDYVILQEMSNAPLTTPERFRESVSALCRQAREAGAVPVLYATWAYEKGGARLAEFGMEYEAMYCGLLEAYHAAAEENGCLIADVGKAFYENLEGLNLYDADSCHPSPAGTQLAAETLMAVIEEDWQRRGRSKQA